MDRIRGEIEAQLGDHVKRAVVVGGTIALACWGLYLAGILDAIALVLMPLTY